MKAGSEDRVSPFDDEFLRAIPRLELSLARLSAREGDSSRGRARRGGRVEFADHRAYVPGDDPRHLDWAAYARFGRLYVKQFERRDEASMLIVVDESGSMALHGKLRAAQRLAYALAYVALAGGHRVRTALCSDGALRSSAEVSGRPRISELRAQLETARGAGATRLSESLRDVADAGRGGRVLVVLSDLWAEDDGRAVLASRARRGDEVTVIHVRAAADLALPGGEVTAEDAETGERRALGPAEAAAAAVDAARREEDWRAFAARHALRYVPVDAAQPTEDLVVRTLRDAGLLR